MAKKNINYTKNSGLWEVQYNGNTIISYSNPNHLSWLNTSGDVWSVGSRTGGYSGDFYIKRLNVYGIN